MSNRDFLERSDQMGTPFHKNVPTWIIRYLSHVKCSQCLARVRKKDVVAIGIRELEDKSASTPYVEYKCPKCEHRAMKSFGGHTKGTVEELCCMLLEEKQNQRRIKQAQKSESRHTDAPAMTDEEVNKFLKSLKNSKSYSELLDEIGATEWLEPDQETNEG